MLKMVDGTGIIGVDMICPLGVSTPQPPNYDRVELEGVGMLVLPNSLDAPLERLELGGKTGQVTTMGVNLFDEKLLLDFGSKNYDKTQSGSGFYYYKFPVSGTVTVSTKNANKNGEYLTVGIKPDGSDKTWLSHGSAAISKYKTLTPEDGNIYLGVNDNLERVKSMIQNTGGIIINEGSVAKPYEPYTGNKPSPSPEYPQEIVNVGKYNKDTGKYEVDVKITGKNLFDKSLLEGRKIVEFNGKECYKYFDNNKNYRYKGKFKNGQQYAFTLRILRPASKESNETGMEIVYTDGTRKWTLFKHGELKTLVSDPGKTIDHFRGGYNYGMDCYLDLSVTRLSVGGQDAGYAPYKEQTLTLTSDRPLTKWDRLVEQDGQIGWLYGGKKYTVTGNEVFQRGAESYYTGSSTDMFYVIPDATGSEGIMKDLSFIKGIWNCTDKEAFCVNVNQLHIRLYNKRIGVSDDATMEEKFKAYKAFVAKRYADGTPFEVYYKTTNPEFVPLPQSEQNAIRALATHYPTTVITADGGELDPDIKVTYRKEK